MFCAIVEKKSDGEREEEEQTAIWDVFSPH